MFSAQLELPWKCAPLFKIPHNLHISFPRYCTCTYVQTNIVWIGLNVPECTLTSNQRLQCPLILLLNFHNFEACLNWHQACGYRNSVWDVLRNSFYFCCKHLLIFSNHLNTGPGFRHFHPLLRSWLEYRARNVWLLGQS